MVKILLSWHADDSGESDVTRQLYADSSFTARLKAKSCVWSASWAGFKEARAEIDVSQDVQRRHSGAVVGAFVSQKECLIPIFLLYQLLHRTVLQALKYI